MISNVHQETCDAIFVCCLRLECLLRILRVRLDLPCTLLSQAISYLAHPSNALASELSSLVPRCKLMARPHSLQQLSACCRGRANSARQAGQAFSCCCKRACLQKLEFFGVTRCRPLLSKARMHFAVEPNAPS